jgi:hypothetical protein
MRTHRKLTGGGGPAGKRSGLVRANGRQMVDDGGAWFPFGLTEFPSVWLMTNEEDRARTRYGWTRDHGFDFSRNFGEVGGSSWADRVINPDDADYADRLARTFDVQYGEFGIRSGFTMFGGGATTNYEGAARKMVDVIRGREESILYVEVSNEENGPDRATIRRIVQMVRATFPSMLVASTRITYDSVDNRWIDDLDVANFVTMHTDRDRGDEDWRQVKQPWDAGGFKVGGSCNEPPGPESSVAVLTDPLRLAMLRANSAMCGLPCFVFHQGAGIRAGGAADRAYMRPDGVRGRSADFWEIDNVEAIVDALRHACDAMPLDAPNWQKVNGHWRPPLPTHPLPADAIWPDGADHGLVRTYGAISGGDFVSLPFGIKRYVDLTAERPSHVDFYDPMSGALAFARDLAQGETMRVDQAQGEAFVVVGRR